MMTTSDTIPAELGLLLLLRQLDDGRRVSLARLRKASELPMSQLQRLLDRLQSHQLVLLVAQADGLGAVELTAQARALLDDPGA